MNRFIKIVTLFSILGLSACANPHVQDARQWLHEVYYGPPKKTVLVPYDASKERWCYRTIGEAECYQKIQRLPPESLISVRPQWLFPHSREAYAKLLAASEMPQPKMMPGRQAISVQLPPQPIMPTATIVKPAPPKMPPKQPIPMKADVKGKKSVKDMMKSK